MDSTIRRLNLTHALAHLERALEYLKELKGEPIYHVALNAAMMARHLLDAETDLHLSPPPDLQKMSDAVAGPFQELVHPKGRPAVM